MSSYNFGDDVEVKPRHFENVKILWRPRKHKDVIEIPEDLGDSGLTHEELRVQMEEMPHDYRYPEQEEHDKMVQKVEDLKKVISGKHPNVLSDEYGFLDHQKGRCDYNPYDRYDAVWSDEASSFGHMFSEGVDPTEELENNEPTPEE